MESEAHDNEFRTHSLFDSYQQHVWPPVHSGLHCIACRHGISHILHTVVPWPQTSQQYVALFTPSVNGSDKKSPPYYIKRTKSLETEPRCQPNNRAGLKEAFKVTFKMSSIERQGRLFCVLWATQPCTVRWWSHQNDQQQAHVKLGTHSL